MLPSLYFTKNRIGIKFLFCPARDLQKKGGYLTSYDKSLDTQLNLEKTLSL